MELSPKLQKRVEILKANGGMVPWGDAIKQHEKLKNMGIVVEGSAGSQKFAVLVTDKVREEMEKDDGSDGPQEW